MILHYLNKDDGRYIDAMLKLTLRNLENLHVKNKAAWLEWPKGRMGGNLKDILLEGLSEKLKYIDEMLKLTSSNLENLFF